MSLHDLHRTPSMCLESLTGETCCRQVKFLCCVKRVKDSKERGAGERGEETRGLLMERRIGFGVRRASLGRTSWPLRAARHGSMKCAMECAMKSNPNSVQNPRPRALTRREDRHRFGHCVSSCGGFHHQADSIAMRAWASQVSFRSSSDTREHPGFRVVRGHEQDRHCRGPVVRPGTSSRLWPGGSRSPQATPSGCVGASTNAPFENTSAWAGRSSWPGAPSAPSTSGQCRAEQVILDGGSTCSPFRGHLWIWDLEILVSEPRPAERTPRTKHAGI